MTFPSVQTSFSSRVSNGLCVLLAVSLTTPVTARAVPIDTSGRGSPTALTENELRNVKWTEIARLKREPIRGYFKDAFDYSAGADQLSDEIRKEVRSCAQAKVFIDTEGFDDWWSENRARYLDAAALGKLADVSVANLTGIVYIAYSEHRSEVLDARDPTTAAKRKREEPTAGDRHLQKVFDAATASSFWNTALGVWDNVTSTASGVNEYLGLTNMLKGALVFGVLSGIVTCVVSPWTDPILQRLTQTKQKYLLKIALPFNYWVTGEYARRRRAKQLAVTGKAEVRTAPIGTSIEEYDKFLTRFKKVGPLVDQNFKSVLGQDFKDARQSMMDVLHRVINGFGDRARTIRIEKAGYEALYRALRPSLAGARPEDLERFAKLMAARKRAVIANGFLSPEVKALESEIEGAKAALRERGLSADVVNELEAFHRDRLTARYAAAESIFEILDFEQLYEEQYTMILGKLREAAKADAEFLDLSNWIFSRQEAAREAVGFYEILGEHVDEVQTLIDPRYRKYDVRMRLASRGHPFGSASAIDFAKIYCSDNLMPQR